MHKVTHVRQDGSVFVFRQEHEQEKEFVIECATNDVDVKPIVHATGDRSDAASLKIIIQEQIVRIIIVSKKLRRIFKSFSAPLTLAIACLSRSAISDIIANTASSFMYTMRLSSRQVDGV